jgi:hypothetical protein
MKKILVIISLLVGVNGFTQTQDTVKTGVFSFKETLNEAYAMGYMNYELWFYTLADYWNVNYNMIEWDFGDDGYFNYTFKSIKYWYYKIDSEGKRVFTLVEMGPEEAYEFFKNKK